MNNSLQKRILELMKIKGYGNSPTALCNRFNLLHDGLPITVQTARSWMIGKSIPKMRKICTLGRVLSASPQYLLFGIKTPINPDLTDLMQSEVDRLMMACYRQLEPANQKLIQELISAMSCKRPMVCGSSTQMTPRHSRP
jgi:transcriptional regulator with XRE-family HTH domain